MSSLSTNLRQENLTDQGRCVCGRRDFDITEIDITQSAITEFDITDTAITESDITESDITRKGKLL